jgi:hypothetical protein
VLDGFVEVLHMGVAAPLCHLALWATTPIHRQKGTRLSDIKKTCPSPETITRPRI